MFNKIKNTITNLNPIIQMQDILYSPMLCSDVIERKIEYDGNPIRLDYTNDGKLLLGNNLNSIPEAWIVTVQKIYKDKKKSKQSQSNKVLFS